MITGDPSKGCPAMVNKWKYFDPVARKWIRIPESMDLMQPCNKSEYYTID